MSRLEDGCWQGLVALVRHSEHQWFGVVSLLWGNKFWLLKHSVTPSYGEPGLQRFASLVHVFAQTIETAIYMCKSEVCPGSNTDAEAEAAFRDSQTKKGRW